jgi:F0F1-type ATP synthase membrane subunit c/vacuolar-type H+-ATPase subunit K
MMTPTNQSTQPNIDARYRTMLTLWFALLVSVGMYFLLVLFMARETINASETPRNTPLIVSLTALGAGLVLLSLVVKQKLLKRSVEQQRIELVQQALIVACALCEVSALLGLVVRFLYNSNEYYLLFLISALGMALHFPRRAQLLSATYRPS